MLKTRKESVSVWIYNKNPYALDELAFREQTTQCPKKTSTFYFSNNSAKN